jgi:uncharacterized protein
MLLYGSAYSNWGILLLEKVYGLIEVAITGPVFREHKNKLFETYVPNTVLVAGNREEIPILENRCGQDSRIYICKNNTCSLPVASVEEAIQLIFNRNSQNGNP